MQRSCGYRQYKQDCKAKIRKTDRMTGGLTVEETVSAEKLWIQTVQAGLKERTSFSQLVSQLGLVESEGVLYCKGRLGESDLSLEAQHPIVLDNKHQYTNLLIKQCHEKAYHSGVRATLAEVRSMYWIPKGRQTVKKVVSKCVVCKKLEGKAFSAPPSTDLPSFRVEQAKPFSTIGVDFAGPLFVRKEGNQTEKVYIALFTCNSTRAVHLDLVEDMSASTFLRCFRKFVARKGTPALVVSDNAKTFKASAKYLRKLYSDPQVRNYLDTNRIRWRFNLDRSPWWGGFFERLVGSVKRPLRKVLGNARLTHDELLTVLLEIESTLNSRPLTYEYDEIGGEMLTPSHLIFGFRLSSLPDVIPSEEEESVPSANKRFHYLSKVRDHFWNRWRREYLTDLREYHRGKCESQVRTVSIGDVVTVFEENVKRGLWKIGKVEEVIWGRDGVVRGAKVKVMTKGKPVLLNRPVQKLYPLEVRTETLKPPVGAEQDDNKTGGRSMEGRQW